MNKEKWQQLGHLIAGLIIIVHGFDTLERGDIFSAAAYFSLAIMFMIVAGAHKNIRRSFMQSDVAFFLLEAVTIFYSGWHYKQTGMPVLYYAMLTAGVSFMVFATFSMETDERPRRHSRRRRHRSSGQSSSRSGSSGSDSSSSSSSRSGSSGRRHRSSRSSSSPGDME